jgi:4-amino-4-deoxy-L-arabinose transferase-like glycosyltransferase
MLKFICKKDYFLPFLIIFALFPVYIFKLEFWPELHGDEGASGVQALFFIKEKNWDIFRVGWAEQPMLSFAFQSIPLIIFESNVFNLRLSSVFFGLISIILFYFLTKLVFNSLKISFITTFFFASSFWLLALSRLGINYIQIMPFQILAMILILLSIKKKNYLISLFAGITSTIPFYLYHAGKAIPLLSIIFFIILISKNKNTFHRNLKKLFILILGILITLIPFYLKYRENPENYFIRTKDVSLINHLDDASRKYNSSNRLTIFSHQLINSLKIITFGGDNSEQIGYQGPLIPLIFQPIFFIGLIFAIYKSLKGNRLWISFLVYLFIVFILGGALTVGPYPPFLPRLSSAIPLIFLIIGIGIKKITPKLNNILLVLLLASWLIINIYIYFVQTALSLKSGWANYDPAPSIGRYLNNTANSEAAIFFGCWKHYPTQGNIGYLAFKFPVMGEIELDEAINYSKNNKKNVSFIFLPYEISELRNWWEGLRKGKKVEKPEKINWDEKINKLKNSFSEFKYEFFYRKDGSENFILFEVKDYKKIN